jgi:hypothetical protein
VRLATLVSGLACVIGLAWSPAARADDAGSTASTTPAPPPSDEGRKPKDEATPAPPAVVDAASTIDPTKRTDPSAFRGRENYTNAGEVLAWVPRVLFFPAYLLTEYVLRWPIYALSGWVDRAHVVPIIDDILHPTPNFSWSPTFALDFGSFVALGVEAKWRNAIVKGHELSGTVLVGGFDGYRFNVRDSWQVGPMKLGVHGGGSYHQDRRFYGFGPKSSQANETFYSDTRYDAFAFAAYDYRNHVHVELGEGFRSDLTGPGYDPALDTRFLPAKIPAYGAQMDLAMATLDVKLDTRRTDLEPSGGARLEGNMTYARDMVAPERSFITTELDGQVGVEISKPDRILSLRAYAVDTFALGREPVPFNYQAMLGFDHHYGFIWGRFRDASALMAELRYHHPIAYFVDMEWIAGVGNVFSQNFADFDPKLLTASFSVGLRTRRTGMLPIQLLVGFGTSRFDEAFNVNMVRVYLANTEGL